MAIRTDAAGKRGNRYILLIKTIYFSGGEWYRDRLAQMAILLTQD